MRELLLVVVVATYYVFGVDINCSSSINDTDNINGTAYVSTGGNDALGDGTEDLPLRSIEGVKQCFGRNTTMIMSPNNGGGNYYLTVPANLSQAENQTENPYFNVLGTGSPESTVIEVNSNDFTSLLHVVGAISVSLVCYVDKATFVMKNITGLINTIPTAANGDHTTLFWIQDPTSVATFEFVKFSSVRFPKHLFVHTGGNLTLKSVQIVPTSSTKELRANVLLWEGTGNHIGSWILDDVTISGPSATDLIDYTYNNSLFEQVLTTPCNLSISLTGSNFKNIKWRAGSVVRQHQSNDDDVPLGVGLVATISGSNNGKVVMSNTNLIGVDAGDIRRGAPIVVNSVPDDPAAAPVFESVGVRDSKGGLAGGFYTRANISITGNSSIGGNHKKTESGGLVENDLDGNATVDLSDQTLSNGRPNVGSGITIPNLEPDPDDKFPPWALAIIIAVGVVVVAAVIVIIACAVYFRKKHYSTLEDDGDYNESSSSSLRSSEKDNEMDSI